MGDKPGNSGMGIALFPGLWEISLGTRLEWEEVKGGHGHNIL